jgi:uncharacterized membrane protein
MQCPVCHSELASPSAAFCNHCGAPLSAAPPVPPSQPAYTPPPAGYPPTPPAYPAQPPASAGLTPNAAAAIAYITVIPAILFLIIEPYNKIPLVRFHSFQSIGLAVVWFVLWFAFLFVHMALLFMAFIHILFGFLEFVVFLGLFIVWLVTILKASKGEWFKLPIIGDFAMKQAQS